MTQIVWLASYPRSGNTWVRFLLYNLHHGAAFASLQVDRFIPSFHKGLTSLHFARGKSPIVKTHLRYHAGMPFAECTEKAIYVYRHPMAVLTSNVRYVMRLVCYERLTFQHRAALVSQLVAEFADNCGLLCWHNAGYGSWQENLRSWLGADREFPVLALRYEDLIRDPIAEIDRICDFVGLRRSAAERQAAADDASEAVLMAMEERELALGWPGLFDNLVPVGSSKWRFIRDTSLEPLSELIAPPLLARATAALAAAGRQFGYE